ncbi:DUF2785 domain-containing protein [Shewanella sp.]|uniref:DUF2785 domain-containing protein n=1 Tax=Shewanella sp. TaxID=50422 RepID=UPI003569ED06
MKQTTWEVNGWLASLKPLWLMAVCTCAVVMHAGAVQARETGSGVVQSCTDTQWSKSALLQLANDQFELASAEQPAMIERLALCLKEDDPQLRDAIGFSGLSQLLRSEVVDQASIRRLYLQLSSDVAAAKNNRSGVYLPFAVLVLSELARVDRKQPYLSDAERTQLVALAATQMQTITDYRGFDEVVGWRHQVAHSADLLLQLILNQALDGKSVQTLVNAIDGQISPAGHSYIFGEPERLARPVLYAMMRQDVPESFWREKLTLWAKPSHIDSWEQAFTSTQGLAQRHNRSAFLSQLMLPASTSTNPALQALAPLVAQALKQVP